jgi:hypothetical protein
MLFVLEAGVHVEDVLVVQEALNFDFKQKLVHHQMGLYHSLRYLFQGI